MIVLVANPLAITRDTSQQATHNEQTISDSFFAKTN